MVIPRRKGNSVRCPRNQSNRGERCENACIFIAEPKGFVLVQIRGDSAKKYPARVGARHLKSSGLLKITAERQ